MDFVQILVLKVLQQWGKNHNLSSCVGPLASAANSRGPIPWQREPLSPVPFCRTPGGVMTRTG